MKYLIEYGEGGYTHEVHVDAFITVTTVALALSIHLGSEPVMCTNQNNGARRRYFNGIMAWTDGDFS